MCTVPTATRFLSASVDYLLAIMLLGWGCLPVLAQDTASLSEDVAMLIAGAEPAGPTQTFRPPYPPSKFIVGVEFDDRTARTEALGSDIWPITWAGDGHLYTAWGDGGGFGGTNDDGRVSFGVARVEGGKRDYRGINLAGGKRAPNPMPFAGKSEGIIAIDKNLYLWRDGEGGSLGYFKSIALWRSDDLGQTWSTVGVRFSKDDGDFTGLDEGIFAPAFCQFGQGYSGARDEYLYIYAPDSIDPTHWNVRLPGRINLLRVPREKIESKAAYEFYAGVDDQGQLHWTKESSKRKPVWEDTVQGTHRIAVSYNPDLKRYLLTTIAINRDGWMSLYEAPEPWGPWSHVHTEMNGERWGTYTIIFSFVNKWLSDDGRDFTIVHTKNDCWSTIEGRFKLADDTPAYPPSPVIASIEWAPKESIVRAAKDGDNWPVTWAADDAIYTTYGDGTGFDPKVEKKLSMGFARITGSGDDFKGVNVRSDSEQLGQGREGKKGWGILCVDEVLYLWLGHADQKGATAQLIWSRDHAKTWTFADWKFAEFGMMGFVNFGKNYTGARDEFVYAYSHNQSRADTPADGFILMRAPKGNLTRPKSWEFYKTLDAEGQPVWTNDIQQRGVVFQNSGRCLRSAMTYCQPLKRYLWWQQLPQPPGVTKDRGDTRFSGGFAIYDAPEPWGPWTTAYYTPKWDVGPGEHGDFPAKWMSSDGKTLNLVFSGDDYFSVREARLKLR